MSGLILDLIKTDRDQQYNYVALRDNFSYISHSTIARRLTRFLYNNGIRKKDIKEFILDLLEPWLNSKDKDPEKWFEERIWLKAY